MIGIEDIDVRKINGRKWIIGRICIDQAGIVHQHEPDGGVALIDGAHFIDGSGNGADGIADAAGPLGELASSAYCYPVGAQLAVAGHVDCLHQALALV